MNFATMIERMASSLPLQIAIKSDERELTYQQINAQANQLARALEKKFAVGMGERVAALLPNCPEFIIAYFACGKVGATFVPCNPNYTASELKVILGHCRPRVILCASETIAMSDEIANDLGPPIQIISIVEAREGVVTLEAVAREMSTANLDRSFEADHDAVILYTSGTTQQSRGAIWTHGNVLGIQMIVNGMDHVLTGEDVALPYVPLFHSWALSIIMRCVSAGAKLIIQRMNAPFNKLIETIAHNRVTFLIAAPQLFHIIASRKQAAVDQALSSVKVANTGSSALAPEVLTAFEQRFGIPLLELYGMTETGYICINRISAPRKSGSVGPPVPYTEVKIVDDGGNGVPAGELGHIVVRGPGMFKGFYGEMVEAPFTEDGWFITGDIGKADEEGYIYLLDRAKDVINNHGEKVHCIEVEHVLRGHPKVADAAVVGMKLGSKEVPIACVIGTDACSAIDVGEILDHCRNNLASFKVPRQLILMEEFPRNSLGKVVKLKLRQMIEQARREATQGG